MLNAQELKKRCAECEKAKITTAEQHGRCQGCPVYLTLNTPCHVCGEIGGVSPFTFAVAKGVRNVLACPTCMKFLT